MISVLNSAAISLRVEKENRDLAVLHPTGGPGILALHAGSGPALLDVAGFVDHQDRIRAAQVLDHITAHVIADRIAPGQPQRCSRLDCYRHPELRRNAVLPGHRVSYGSG